MTPKRGGYTTLARALDLTTSLQGDFPQSPQLFWISPFRGSFARECCGTGVAEAYGPRTLEPNGRTPDTARAARDQGYVPRAHCKGSCESSRDAQNECIVCIVLLVPALALSPPIPSLTKARRRSRRGLGRGRCQAGISPQWSPVRHGLDSPPPRCAVRPPPQSRAPRVRHCPLSPGPRATQHRPAPAQCMQQQTANSAKASQQWRWMHLQQLPPPREILEGGEGGGGGKNAFEGNGPQRRPHRWLGRVFALCATFMMTFPD